MAGYGGKLLRVDLSRGQISQELIPEEAKLAFVGGRGLGIKYLYDELAPGTDPLGPGNKLLLLNGPLAGTNAQSVSRWMVITKSPLTGAYARSVAGADFGAWLKFAGYDLIILEGQAARPVYLHIGREGAELRDAGEIWGQNTQETQEWLVRQHGPLTRSACIGPAGERLVRFAAIVSARRTASRCGVGAVMGAKRLKAVAITTQRHIELADPEAFRALVREQIGYNKEDLGYQNSHEMGTTGASSHFNRLGIFPVRNFRAGQMKGSEEFSGDEYRKLRVGEFGCYSCSARCGKHHRVLSGPYAGAESEGPEYESIWAFTGPIDSANLGATVAADQLCDDLGMDTISTGNAIGFAFEIFEKGIITEKDTDGLKLRYGNHAAMVELIHKIGRREGLGAILAEGVARAAEHIGHGASAYAMHAKGLELPAYEPRAAKAHGLNYATSNIGGSHCFGYAAQEIFGVPVPRPVDRFADTGKGDIAAYNQNRTALTEMGIVCTFAAGWRWFGRLYHRMLTAATGIPEFDDRAYLAVAAERLYNLERCFNVREGFSRAQDTLPQRMLTEPLEQPGGPAHGQVVRAQDALLDEYYAARGWNADGIPTAEKLRELGLEGVISSEAGGLPRRGPTR